MTIKKHYQADTMKNIRQNNGLEFCELQKDLIHAPQMIYNNALSGVIYLLFGILMFSAHPLLAGGLTTNGAEILGQGINGLPGLKETGDGFGSELSTGDFNGDGFKDAVVGYPDEDWGPMLDVGHIMVIYGSNNGLEAILTPEHPAAQEYYNLHGTANVVSPGDRLGAAITTGDFNNDGFDDLAVGSPGREVNGNSEAGQVDIVYGSASGLDISTYFFLNQYNAAISGTAEAGDQFGSALTAGDFNGDGVDDLIVGVQGENSNTGLIHIFWGSQANGLTVDGSYYHFSNSSEIEGGGETNDRYGAVLTTGNFNADEYDDVVVSAPGETVLGHAESGAFNIIYGSATGLNVSVLGNQQYLFPFVLGGISADNEHFAAALTTGDFNNDGINDLVVGQPDFIRDDFLCQGSGQIYIFFGSTTGVQTTNYQIWNTCNFNNNFFGIASHFGSALTSGDFNADSIADIAIGVPGEAGDPGGTAIFYGTHNGVYPANQNLLQDEMGIEDDGEAGDRFGAALIAGDFDNDSASDLLIGLPGSAPDSAVYSGGVISLKGLISQTVTVDSENPALNTIQEAIDSLPLEGAGDIVLVPPGHYTGEGNKNIDFGGRTIIVKTQGQSQPENTVIDLEYDGTAFIFHSAETPGAQIDGFAIKNGTGYPYYSHSSDSPQPTLGGGVSILNSSSPTLKDCLFINNQAYNGGAVGISQGEAYISNCRFFYNSASNDGGAIFSRNTSLDSNLQLSSSSFFNNSSSSKGGGIYTQYMAAIVESSIFSQNKSITVGGAVYSDASSSNENLTLRNSAFLANNSQDGGAVAVAGSTDNQITHCTFTENKATNSGGSLFLDADTIFINSISWNNSSAKAGNEISFADNSNAELQLGYSDIEGGIVAINTVTVDSLIDLGNNIDLDPVFSQSGDIRITAPSPCIDSGTNSPAGGLTAEDIFANPRIIDGNNDTAVVTDMGAYEYPFQNEVDFPLASIAPNFLIFYANRGVIPPDEQIISIVNDGTGLLNWSASIETIWSDETGDMIRIEPVSGEITDETDKIKVFVNKEWFENRPRGVFSANIRIETNTSNLPVIIPVALQINAPLRVGVNLDFPTIQDAVSAARDGDTILLTTDHRGVGNTNIRLYGKAITITAENDSAAIDCEYVEDMDPGNGRAFTLEHGETSATVIQGITIRNCNADSLSSSYQHQGGGIYVAENSSPTLTDIYFFTNSVTKAVSENFGEGGGLYYGGSGGKIRNCRFNNNSAKSGGAVYLSGTNNQITEGSFDGNSAEDGGAVYSAGQESHISNAVFNSNNAENGGPSSGGAVFISQKTQINNCLIVGNTAQYGGGVSVGWEALETVIFNTILKDNNASINGGGIDTNPEGFAIINTTLYNNDADGVGDGINVVREGQILNTVIWEGLAIDNPQSISWSGDPGGYVSDLHINSLRVTGSVPGELGINYLNAKLIPNDSTLFNSPFIDPMQNDFRINAAGDYEYKLIDQGIDIDWLYSDYRSSLRPIDGDDNGTDLFDIGALEYSMYYGGSTADSVANAFQELHLVSTSLVVNQLYEIMWEDKDPFPELYRRIEQAGEYAVNIALVNEAGYRIDLVNNEMVQVSLTGYKIPFTFDQEHRGTWQLRLEFADDPNQYILSEQIIIEYKETTTYYLGQEIKPPAGAFPGLKPDFDEPETCHWSINSGKLYATAARFVIITWYGDENRTIPIPVVASIRFPETGYSIHVADTPPVNIMVEGAEYDLVQLKYANNDARLASNSFTATQEGWALLLFADNETGTEIFETIRTLTWNSEDILVDLGVEPLLSVDIGSALAGTKEELYTDPDPKNPVHDSSCGSGYVYFENSPYDGYGEQKSYDRFTRQGQIFPVNIDTTGAINDPAVDPLDDLVVVWYQKNINNDNNICWPGLPVRYAPAWPTTADKIIIASQEGSGPLAPETYGTLENMAIYNQPDPKQPGYNPNEEHAMFFTALGSSYPAVYALRNDLNIEETSSPYVLLKYRDPLSSVWKMEAWQVVAEETGATFDYEATAGNEITPPYPLNQMLFGPCEGSSVVETDYILKDLDDKIFAIQGDVSIGTTFFYKQQEGFYFDRDHNGEQDVLPGTCIAWLDGADSLWTDTPQIATYAVSWPDPVPTLHIGETLVSAKTQPGESVGLPEIGAQCKVDILYEDPPANLVKLFDPLTEGSITYHLTDPEGELPAGLKPEYDLGTGRWVFTALPYHIQIRLTYDPVAIDPDTEESGMLKLKGVYSEGTGEPTLLLNQLSARETSQVTDLTVSTVFIDKLALLNNANILNNNSVKSSLQDAEMKALTAGDAEGTGYATLAFNNDKDCPAPTMLSVIQVDCPLYTGEIDVFESSNPFEEQVALRHNGDFGGNSDEKSFQWQYMMTTDVIGIPESDDTHWLPYTAFEPAATEHSTQTGFYEGAVDTVISGSGEQLLTDKWFSVRYYDLNVEGGICESPYSPWTPAQLYEGWIKRVMKKINLFDQKIKDFHASDVNTQTSMISLAGDRYEGPIALSDDPEYLQNLGMIKVYETLLERGEGFINGDTAVNQTVMFAANRLADLHMLLGNEAYADAADPTIGFSTESGVYGTQAPSIFCFQNQVDTLLDEELVLLRGRDNAGVRPFYNRFIWNFTLGDGEVAYKENYNITDQLTEDSNGDTFPDAQDGEINEWDAKIQYPQGHGDAWGYYLSATKRYYRLLKNSAFTWIPTAEAILVAGTPVEVDYRDERKFAVAAAAKAKAGSEIVNLTYRKMYTENPEGQWQGYKDIDEDRAWGVDSWARRTGQAALFDWAVGNAVLPESSELEGIQKIDRTTVLELSAIAAEYQVIESQVDNADAGLNPLGLAKGIVPFDIDPAAVANGETHFEQIYSRAVQATNNAIAVFNHANESSQLLRRQQDSLADFQRNIENSEVDYNNRLIEIFGYPYADDCGPGKTYATDYCQSGPDLYHYMYVDASELMGEETVQVYEFPVTLSDIGINRDGSLIEQAKDVTFHIATDSRFGMVKPDSWYGRRKAQGAIQIARSELLQTRGRFEKVLIDYDNLLAQLENQADILRAQYGLNSNEIFVLNETLGEQIDLNTSIMVSRGAQLGFRLLGRLAPSIADVIKEAFPLVVGTATDGTSLLRAAAKAVGVAGLEMFGTMADIASLGELGFQQAKEVVSAESNITITALRNEFAAYQQLKQLENGILSEASVRHDLYVMAETLRQSAERYRSTLAQAERLIADRTRFRTQTAAQIQDYRYKDMAFRIFRNDALQKYRAQFDMAARYVYLAAKAYDYETTLLNYESMAGEQFLTDIVKQRAIGQIENGQPLTGTGLADPMRRMWQNFQVLKPQLGFNNPQIETNRFSLRQELFRVKMDLGSNVTWKQVLEEYRVDNIWDRDEYRRYCRPFAEEGVSEPGIIIPFSTTVNAGLNFFHWPLGGGDSYYSSSNFATKVRSVGVWFSNYNAVGLALTPRIYLVPVGEDVLRTPSYNTREIRTWQVVDQKLPTPFPIVETEMAGDPDWIPSVDTIYDDMFEIRRHSDFRAYHDSGYLNESEMVFDSRLVGRSVWNNKWLLIIPGRALLYDGEEGIDTFINGPEVFGGLPGERTGNGISDIKLFFSTYSYSGN